MSEESPRSRPVTVLGSINQDLVVRSPRLPALGETVTGGTFHQLSGGKGANQAVAAARSCEMPVTFIAAIGNDAFGREMLDALRTENLKLDHLLTLPEPTGVALILVDHEGRNLISVASGANAALEPEHITNLPESVFPSGGVLLTNLETPSETVLTGLQRAKAAGMTTILNPAPASKLIRNPRWLNLIDWLTPNETELALLVDHPVDTLLDAASAFETLRGFGVQNLVLTRGSEGIVVFTDGVSETGANHRSIPAPKVEAIDTTAAGDAFNGILAVGLASGLPPEQACERAVRGASLSVTRMGAQPSIPTAAEIDALE